MVVMMMTGISIDGEDSFGIVTYARRPPITRRIVSTTMLVRYFRASSVAFIDAGPRPSSARYLKDDGKVVHGIPGRGICILGALVDVEDLEHVALGDVRLAQHDNLLAGFDAGV